jgi:xylan 1,4-beta-xylosidase
MQPPEIKNHIKRTIVISLLALGFFLPVMTFLFVRYGLRESFASSKVTVDAGRSIAPLYFNWQAIAQGGEEPSGSRMFINILPPLKALHPRYIRLDHLYDYYSVVSRAPDSSLLFDWSKLDRTVCDIYAVGAKPFLVLGYMPSTISSDGTPIAEPSKWSEWSLLVQKTIEHYSGQKTRICNDGVYGDQLTDIYYEVWNEPDLGSFGSWKIHDGAKDYRTLYFYSSEGARNAQSVNRFLLGGPAPTAPYLNWFKLFLDYVQEHNLRIDFLSWHRYSLNPEEFKNDTEKVNAWLPRADYEKYFNLPKIVSEWGADSGSAPINDSQMGAAFAVAAAKHLMEQKIQLAFHFEAIDGANDNFGILTQSGEKKPRYHAFEMLNALQGYRVQSNAEDTPITVIASKSSQKLTILLSNYDAENKRVERFPLAISNMAPGSYKLTATTLGGVGSGSEEVNIESGDYERIVIMIPNQITLFEFVRVP